MGYELEDVEKPFVELLTRLGWTHVPGCTQDPSITGRASFKEVMQEGSLREKLRTLNLRDGKPWLDEERLAEAIGALTRLGTSHLIDANQKATDLLHQGYTVQGLPDWNGGRNQTIQYIDWETPANNQFTVINQYRVDCPPGHDMAKKFIIPDIVLLVNGIPLVVVECKSPKESDGLAMAVDQLRSYSNQRRIDGEVEDNEGSVPLFQYNQAMIVTTFDKARAGTITSGFVHYAPWKTLVDCTGADQQDRVSVMLGKDTLSEQERLIAGMLTPANLLDMSRNFVLFMQTGGKTIKVLCRYQQYRAVNLAIRRMKTSPTRQQNGEFDKRGGIIWHTQGSGKSLTMVFLVRKMRLEPDLRKFKVVMVTDRKDLQKQLSATASLTGEVVEIGTNTSNVKKMVSRKGPGLIFATIQKQRNTDAPRLKEMKKQDVAKFYPVLNDDESILVLVDEAHRSHAKDLHAMLIAGLPNCAKIAFTGTPIIMGKKKHTSAIFGEYIDRYTIKESEEDGSTVPILYEGRTAKGGVKDGTSLDEKFVDMFGASKEKLAEIKKKYATKGHILDAPELIEEKARDMLQHYVLNILPNGYKAQVVAHSRLATIRYYKAFQKAREDMLAACEQLSETDKNMPTEEAIEKCTRETQVLIWAWKQKDILQALEFAPIISGTNTDAPNYKQWTNGTKQDQLIKRFKKSLGKQPADHADPLAFLIVKSMLLAGFDAPIEAVMYLDRSIKEAELLQAIARVNRTGFKKTHGIIVDYFGVAHHLQQALAVYAKEDVEGALQSIKDQLPILRQRHHDACKIFLQRDVDFRKGTDIEDCLQTLANDKLRAQFSVNLKRFLMTLDAVLPRPEALQYTPDAKQLAYIYARARNRYRDTVELGKDVGKKVQDLIDKHVVSLGIDPKIKPIELTDPKFAQYAAGQGSKRSKASEMEHAIRSHLSKHMDEDPELYTALSKKLDRILKSCGEHWDDLIKKLQQVIDEMTGKEPTSDPLTEGMAEYYAPFIRVMAAAHKQKDKEFSAEEIKSLQDVTGEVVGMMTAEIQNNKDLWSTRKAADQEALNSQIFEHLATTGMDQDKAGILADKLMEVAKANTHKLIIL